MKKDVDIARRYYLQAAERGNAKAMHNLAVLDADGGGKGAELQERVATGSARPPTAASPTASSTSASSMPAASASNRTSPNPSNGSASRRPRATRTPAASATTSPKRLDAQSLAAAKLAIQTFTPEPQPDDAVNAAAPPAGGMGFSPGAPAHAQARRQAGRRPSAPPPPFTRDGRDAALSASPAAHTSAHKSVVIAAGEDLRRDRLATRTDCRPKIARTGKIASAEVADRPCGRSAAHAAPVQPRRRRRSRPAAGGISGRSRSSSSWFPASAFAPTGTCRSRRPGTTGRTSTSRRA
mgnify:CR=1 FL=1